MSPLLEKKAPIAAVAVYLLCACILGFWSPGLFYDEAVFFNGAVQVLNSGQADRRCWQARSCWASGSFRGAIWGVMATGGIIGGAPLLWYEINSRGATFAFMRSGNSESLLSLAAHRFHLLSQTLLYGSEHRRIGIVANPTHHVQ